MKKLFLILLIFISIQTSAQIENTEFIISSSDLTPKLTPYVIANCDSLSAEQLYESTINWIKTTYKDPNKVILSQIENEYIRFEGIYECLFMQNTLGIIAYTDGKYQIEIKFKDSKYKFSVISLQQYIKPSWYDINLHDFSNAYNSKGEFKKLGYYRYYDNIPYYFNKLNFDLKEYIKSDQKTTEEEIW